MAKPRKAKVPESVVDRALRKRPNIRKAQKGTVVPYDSPPIYETTPDGREPDPQDTYYDQ